MPIISSLLAEDSVQIDRRRWIREQYTDQVGVMHERVYMAEVGQAVDLVAGAALIEAELTATELAANEAEILNAGI